jgi:phage gpG-like protein
MARVSIDIQGGAQLAAALKKLGADGERAISQAVNATGIEVRSDIIKRYQRGPKTGAVYTEIFRTINGKAVPIGPRQGNNLSASHRASAPGEAPATDTGRLASATEYKNTGKFTAEVGNSVIYGAMLEFGTQKIAPRPAWVPAVEWAAPRYVKRLETALARLMK